MRARHVLSSCALTALTAAVLAPVSAAHADPTRVDRSQTFTAGSTSTFTVPAGVTSLTVGAVGGAGGSSDAGTLVDHVLGVAAPGGRGATVRTTLTVTPGQVLQVHVGSAGTSSVDNLAPAGGANGGGAGGASTLGRPGAGGGGASDVRTCGSASPTATCDSLVDRVLVAAGGGGAGVSTLTTPTAAGGDAGQDGTAGTLLGLGTANPGQAAHDSTGGLGGTTTPLVTNISLDGKSGKNGALGTGGAGADSAYRAAGGGGGGLAGGGGGGAYTDMAGAGGGGSSLVPAGATTGLADQTTPASVTFGWSIDAVAPTVSATPTTTTGSGTVTTAPNRYGWYRSTVTVRFTCQPGTGSVTCPDPVVYAQGKHAAKTVTVTDSDGVHGSATVPAINVDTTKPKVTVKGATRGKTYRSARKLRCYGADALSGIAACKVKVTTKTYRHYRLYRWTGIATDKAGNAVATQGYYKVRRH